MSRSKHDQHFAAYWVAQCARADRWRNNLAPDVPIAQPAERTQQSSGVNGENSSVRRPMEADAEPSNSALKSTVTARRDGQRSMSGGGESRPAAVSRRTREQAGRVLATEPMHSVPCWPDKAGQQLNVRAKAGCAGSIPVGSVLAGVAPGPLTPSKYGNVRTGAYASKREAKRAAVLRLLERSGAIRNLREQVEFVLIPRQLDEHGKVAERACIYRADFVYTDNATGREVVEDSKGVRTADYIIKRKLLRYLKGIVVRET